MIYFTPKKFFGALELNNIVFTNLVKSGIYRSYFIPRYKQGSKKIKTLEITYKKGLSLKTIEKVADVLVNKGFINVEKSVIINAFVNDNFDALIPDELR